MVDQNSKTSRLSTKRADAFKVYEILKNAGNVVNGYYEYKPGWNDTVVAKSVGENMSIWSVKSIRQTAFGKMKDSFSGVKKSVSDKRISELETLFLQLSDRIARLESSNF